MSAVIYEVTLTGKQPLFLDNRNLEFASRVKDWSSRIENVNKSVAGDERSPAWFWLGKVYYDHTTPERWISLPHEMLNACFRDMGMSMKHPIVSAKSLKGASQSGMSILTPFAHLEVKMPMKEDSPGSATQKHEKNTNPWQKISYAPLHHALNAEENFDVHSAMAATCGIRLDVRYAVPPGQRSQHIRVRPQFFPWRVGCQLMVTDDIFVEKRTEKGERLFLLKDLLQGAGITKGFGNWRPGSRKPGPYGTFEVEVKRTE